MGFPAAFCIKGKLMFLLAIGDFTRLTASIIQNFHGRYLARRKKTKPNKENNMSYKLTSQTGESFQWDNVDYPRVLELAVMHGWNPQGTAPTFCLIEEMSPSPGNSKEVSSVETMLMGRSLELAMENIIMEGGSSEEPEADNTGTRAIDRSGWTTEWEELGLYHANLSNRWGYWVRHKDRLDEFIQFLQQGSYRVELSLENSHRTTKDK
jgi:hypothetical protein